MLKISERLKNNTNKSELKALCLVQAVWPLHLKWEKP
jgi:hypothetical protein